MAPQVTTCEVVDGTVTLNLNTALANIYDLEYNNSYYIYAYIDNEVADSHSGTITITNSAPSVSISCENQNYNINATAPADQTFNYGLVLNNIPQDDSVDMKIDVKTTGFPGNRVGQLITKTDVQSGTNTASLTDMIGSATLTAGTTYNLNLQAVLHSTNIPINGETVTLTIIDETVQTRKSTKKSTK